MRAGNATQALKDKSSSISLANCEFENRGQDKEDHQIDQSHESIEHNYPLQDLRKSVQAIQEAQKNLGIQSQAAIDPFSGLSAGTKVVVVLTGWAAAVFSHEIVKFVNDKIAKPLGKHWNDELFGNEEVRDEAIRKLTEVDIENPREVVQAAEFAFREYVIGSLQASSKELGDAQNDIRKITAALEGLYQLDGSAQKKVYLDSSMKHGWQDHNSFLRVTSTISGVISAFTNPINWIKGTTTKEIEKHTATPDVTQAKGWYKRNNACDLIADLLEDCIEGTFKLDEPSKESLRRILILNWKVPVTASGTGIQGTKIPQTSRSKAYRLGMYNTMLNQLDHLFLKTPLSKVPENLKTKATDLRTSLQNTYAAEVGLEKTNPGQYDKDVVLKIEEILHISGDSIPDEMPKWAWNTAAKKQREIELKNQERLVEFQSWGHLVPTVGLGIKSTKGDLEKVFAQLSQDQKERLGTLKQFFEVSSFPNTEVLNNGLHLDDKVKPGILNIMNLDNPKKGERLCQNNRNKGLFLFNYLNTVLDRMVSVSNSSPKLLKEYLDPEIREYLLSVSKMIVNDKHNFPEPSRNNAFYTDPDLSTVPGQALILHHKLAPCFTNGGYVDIYGLKERMIEVASKNFDPRLLHSNEKAQNGFLLSGPIGTGKTFAAKALANQLAVPLYTLKRNSIVGDRSNFMVKLSDHHDEIPLGYFLSEIKRIPCVLLLDETDKILIPKGSDPERRREPTDEEEAMTGAFLTDLQDFRDEKNKDASNVIVIYTTNYPPSAEIDLTKIDQYGYSQVALDETKKYISSASLRRGRIDFYVFSFHRLYDLHQGEALVRHFLEPYITSGRLDEPSNYSSIADEAKNYTPGDIEQAFEQVAIRKTGKLTLQDLQGGLKTIATRESALASSEREDSIKAVIRVLARFKGKKVVGNLDLKRITIASTGLTDEQVMKALEEYTPEVLTQENILAAFEQVRKV